MAQTHFETKRLNFVKVQPLDSLRLILVRHHHGDGGSRGMDVERAASGDEFNKFRGAVVVADIERERQAVATGAAALDGKSEHPDYIPQPPGFILPGDIWRHGDISVKHRAGEKDREADTRFGGDFRDIHLKPVRNCLGAGVRVNDFAKGRFVVGVHGISG